MSFSKFLAVFALTLLSACAMPPPRWLAAPVPVGLPPNVIGMLKNANIPAEAMGAILVRASDGKVILSHHAETPMQPASTMKLLTAIVSLEKLGPTYRGRTEIRSRAKLFDGVLEGDLILRGRADPDLDADSFRIMLQSLRNNGIREIRGNLVVDRHAFRPPRADIGVPPFDEAPEFRYNVIPDALLLNTNLLKFTLESGKGTLAVRTAPGLDRVEVEPRFALVDRPCDKWEEGWKIPVVRSGDNGLLQIRLSGEFPENCVVTTELNVLDRADFADRLFRAQWRELGGIFTGVTREDSTPDGTRLLAEHKSRTLAEFARDINKRSDNPITRLTFLTLGMHRTDDDAMMVTAEDTATIAEREVRAWLRTRGISDEGLVLENGSGLSRKERIQPRQLADVLRAAAASPWAPELLASIPIVGIDGAMRSRLKDSPGAQHARFKTGTLNNTSAVAGYVKNSAKEQCILVAIINHSPPNGPISPMAKPILDALIDWSTRSGI